VIPKEKISRRVDYMKKVTGRVAALWALIVLIAAGKVSVAEEKPVKLVPILKINTELDRRTVIKPSTIPGGGNGLFAAASIKKDEVIGELGGQLRTEEDYPAGNYYLASIPQCAWEETQPYRYLDSKDFGTNVSRINFAPKSLNGVETKFQNSALIQLCNYPYIVFTALRDIEPGEEIWASYGPHYDYSFMAAKEVRGFFCALAKIECGEEYAFEP
jgi:SET domain-containing protein